VTASVRVDGHRGPGVASGFLRAAVPALPNPCALSPSPGSTVTTHPQQPEVWLRGPVPGISAHLQPVAHALLQAMEDVERIASGLNAAELWARPGAAASVGFHLQHMAGSLDRLLAYARGEPLSPEQRADLAIEGDSAPDITVRELLARLHEVVGEALEQLASTADDDLDTHRPVGRAALPSSVRGLLHHAGEHTARHAGQVSTTVKILKGLGPGPT